MKVLHVITNKIINKSIKLKIFEKKHYIVHTYVYMSGNNKIMPYSLNV